MGYLGETVSRSRAAASVPAVAAALAAAAPASALPTLEPLKRCYVTVQSNPGTFTTESVVVGGSGFTPNAPVDLSVDGDVVFTTVADSAGLLSTHAFPTPAIRSGERSITVTALEPDRPYQFVSLESKVTALVVHVRPKRARPAQRVRFRGRGFTDSGPIYAHYLRRGKLRRTVRLARAGSGACGAFSVRRPQFPFRPRQGVWRVQIDQHSRLGDDGPLIVLAIDVRRRPRT